MCAGREERAKGEVKRGSGSALADESMKVIAPSVSLLFVSGSRDALGKQSRNRTLVLPGSPSQPGEKG